VVLAPARRLTPPPPRIEAADYPLSIVMVGLGDGPFGLMASLVRPLGGGGSDLRKDDLLPKRLFDNVRALLWPPPPLIS
jgi:hypothetical protein